MTAIDDEFHEFEKNYWHDCVNTYYEETKHFNNAKRMGIEFDPQFYGFKSGNKNIIDIGGGPVSMLLKCQDLKVGAVFDPIEWPDWVRARYHHKNIHLFRQNGEDIDIPREHGWDEVWIYNCLQHVIDPKKIIQNALRIAPVLRIHEWINQKPSTGHPHELKADKLDEWIGRGFKGNIEHMGEAHGHVWTSYAGVATE